MTLEELSSQEKERLDTLNLLLSEQLDWDLNQDQGIVIDTVDVQESEYCGDYGNSKTRSVDTEIIVEDLTVLSKGDISIESGYVWTLDKKEVYVNGVLKESSPISFSKDSEDDDENYNFTFFDEETERVLNKAIHLGVAETHLCDDAIRVLENKNEYFDLMLREYLGFDKVEAWYKNMTEVEAKHLDKIDSGDSWEWQAVLSSIKPAIKFDDAGAFQSSFDEDLECYADPVARGDVTLTKNHLDIFVGVSFYFGKNEDTGEWEFDWDRVEVDSCKFGFDVVWALEIFTSKTTDGKISDETKAQLESLSELALNVDDYKGFPKIKEIVVPLLKAQGIDQEVKAILQ